MISQIDNIFVYYSKLIASLIAGVYGNNLCISVDKPRDRKFGDLTTNIAMALAKTVKQSPVDIAHKIQTILREHEMFENVDVVNPGFINWKIPARLLQAQIRAILADNYGAWKKNGKKINIEYVSANPTGPLHAGHARGAVVGDALARLLAFAGYDITKEYYINDAGNQVDNFAKSLFYRYSKIYDTKYGLSNTPDCYGEYYSGEYVGDLAKDLANQIGDKFYNQPEHIWMDFFKKFAIDSQMKNIKQDLQDLGIKHDVFTSEKQLVEDGLVDKCIDFLKDKGLIYRGILTPPKGKVVDDWEAREQLLFRASLFGDDTDRPLQKSDGSWTYFATDIAYHYDKINRGFQELIDFWGADHGGYVKRMTAAVEAVTGRKNCLSVKICQLVKFIADGKEVKMSKRAGTFITVRDVIDKVGKDVVRFIMLTRKDDASLDFDFEKVIEQSKENPVFYVQYALARTYSVLRQFQAVFKENSQVDFASVELSVLNSPQELELVQVLAQFPKMIEIAASTREPHRVAFYLSDVAAAFHSLWNSGKAELQLRFINEKDFNMSSAKLCLVLATQKILELGLGIIGVTPVKELK